MCVTLEGRAKEYPRELCPSLPLLAYSGLDSGVVGAVVLGTEGTWEVFLRLLFRMRTRPVPRRSVVNKLDNFCSKLRVASADGRQ